MAQFDLHRLTADSVTLRHWDSHHGRQALVEVAVAQWESWGRPVALVVTASPAPRIAPDPSPAPAITVTAEQPQGGVIIR